MYVVDGKRKFFCVVSLCVYEVFMYDGQIVGCLNGFGFGVMVVFDWFGKGDWVVIDVVYVGGVQCLCDSLIVSVVKFLGFVVNVGMDGCGVVQW